MGRLKSPPRVLAPAPRAVGYATRQDAERARDRMRRQGNNLRRLYNTKRWRDLRLVILERDDWTCRGTGTLLIGKAPAPNSPVVDHITPHRGNLMLFWDTENLQAVCKEYHDTEKQRLEAAELAAAQVGGGSNP